MKKELASSRETQPNFDLGHPVLMPKLRTSQATLAVPEKRKEKVEIKNKADWTQVFKYPALVSGTGVEVYHLKSPDMTGCPAAFGVEHLLRLRVSC